MKVAVDAEIKRAAAQDDCYDQQCALNFALWLGVSFYSIGGPADDNYLLALERQAKDELSYDRAWKR
jgi:hypothetical protein